MGTGVRVASVASCKSQRGKQLVAESTPSVSVVVITRDRPYDLEVCLRAVLASNFSDFELVVVDQSAKATSAEIVAGFAARDKRVRLVPDDGAGAARARNIGTRETTGE